MVSPTKQRARQCITPECLHLSCAKDGLCRRCRGVQPRLVLGKTHTCAPPPNRRTRSTTYRAVHKRVQRTRGPAAEQRCRCGDQAHEWAYDHADPRPLVGTTPRGIPAEYSADVMRYVALCRRCHSIFDRRT